jgi:D-beta-D-heptose 7-phosphate kinase/D-beta-D-heptose 1-phosphate adenosyltransferase
LKTGNAITNKILTLQPLMRLVEQWRFFGKTISFTNGCFDILHQGHISTLVEAANNSDVLIVGLNSDDSVKKLKGESRPVNSEQSRAIMLASLMMVDAVVVFPEETPLQLINTILPDVLVKGGDYKLEEIVGAKEVEERGGKVIIHPLLHDFSTSAVIEKLKTTTTDTTKA